MVQTVRRMSRQQVGLLVEDLFNNTDDTLFELADRADGDTHQVMYFDSMRIIRLQRAPIIKAFLTAIDEQFSALFSPNRKQQEEAEQDADGYALLEQDEMELSVAISGIVSKITSQFSLPIMQLTKRLSALAAPRTVLERENPLGPYALSNAFAGALQQLDVNIRVRIIIMKMFERFVMERIGPTIEAVNRTLIEAGVLPRLDVSSSPQRPPARSAETSDTAAPSKSTADSAQGSDAIDFGTIQALLAATRAPQSQAGGPSMAAGEVLELLNQVQHIHGAERVDLASGPVKVDLAGLVVGDSSGRSLAQADDDTINFISMLFDFILDDRNLAVPMQAVLARLQIPLLKVALSDRSFFSNPNHSARLLLNELSSAGVGWSASEDLERDVVFEQIHTVVSRILQEFSTDLALFDQLLQDFREFLGNENRRSLLVEQRVRETESGKAKTRQAKIQVQNLVNDKASGLRLPPTAGRFISEHWSRVLVMRYIKGGEQCAEWLAGISTFDRLLWTLQPLRARSDIATRVQQTGPLIDEITAGMQEIGCAEEVICDFTDWLKAHIRALSRSDLDQLGDEPSTTDEALAQEAATEALQQLVLEQSDEADDVQIPEHVAAQLDTLCEGTWLEFAPQSGTIGRCKLATVTQPGDMHVFVNRRGMKVMQLSRSELADKLAQQHVAILDQGQVFDRALHSVITNLRETQSA